MARSHEEIDRRSIALHRRVAERLRQDPSLLKVARANLERWRTRSRAGDLAADSVRQWQEILDTRSLEELCDLLVRDDEDATRLRQSSPFAGVLTAAEVWEIKRRFNGEEVRA